MGERSHLLDPKINLATHVTDIVNVIKWEGLKDIVLVGHSYGGVIISGVADQMHDSIGSIVFLDAFVPETRRQPGRTGLAAGARSDRRAGEEGRDHDEAGAGRGFPGE